ncbi:MAG: hypothetical protein JNL11_10305 [Bdellovibrionaceae bacterium]|nr:hypothetical protein [Pseudobdellovibrionaceae bacterium]
MFWDYYYPLLFLVLSALILYFGLRKEVRKFKVTGDPSLMDRIYFLFNFALVLIFGGTFFAGSIVRLIYLVTKST